MRVLNHPILGKLEKRRMVKIIVDGKALQALEGEPIITALLANGIRVCRITKKRNEPRFLFCGIGQCTDCIMTVDGIPNVRTCVTPVRDRMQIETQIGSGKWSIQGAEY